MPVEDDIRQIGLRFPHMTIQKLKILGIETNRNVSEITIEALQLWWEEKGHRALRGDLTPSAAPQPSIPELK